MTETAPKPNFAVRCVQKIAGVPKRFTAAFIGILPLFVWIVLMIRAMSFIGDDSPYHWTDRGLVHDPEDPDPFPFARIVFANPWSLSLDLFLVAQIALCIAFALSAERGIAVSLQKRVRVCMGSFLCCALFAAAMSFLPWNFADHIFQGTTVAVLTCAPAAVPLIALGSEEGKKEAKRLFNRNLLAALIAGLIAFAALFGFSFLWARLPSPDSCYSLGNAFILSFVFFWLFMAGIPATRAPEAQA